MLTDVIKVTWIFHQSESSAGYKLQEPPTLRSLRLWSCVPHICAGVYDCEDHVLGWIQCSVLEQSPRAGNGHIEMWSWTHC